MQCYLDSTSTASLETKTKFGGRITQLKAKNEGSGPSFAFLPETYQIGPLLRKLRPLLERWIAVA